MLSLKADMSSIPIYPPTLFRGAQIGRSAKFLQTLTYEKGHQEIDPGGHQVTD